MFSTFLKWCTSRLSIRNAIALTWFAIAQAPFPFKHFSSCSLRHSHKSGQEPVTLSTIERIVPARETISVYLNWRVCMFIEFLFHFSLGYDVFSTSLALALSSLEFLYPTSKCQMRLFVLGPDQQIPQLNQSLNKMFVRGMTCQQDWDNDPLDRLWLIPQ